MRLYPPPAYPQIGTPLAERRNVAINVARDLEMRRQLGRAHHATHLGAITMASSRSCDSCGEDAAPPRAAMRIRHPCSSSFPFAFPAALRTFPSMSLPPPSPPAPASASSPQGRRPQRALGCYCGVSASSSCSAMHAGRVRSAAVSPSPRLNTWKASAHARPPGTPAFTIRGPFTQPAPTSPTPCARSTAKVPARRRFRTGVSEALYLRDRRNGVELYWTNRGPWPRTPSGDLTWSRVPSTDALLAEDQTRPFYRKERQERKDQPFCRLGLCGSLRSLG